MLRVGVTGGIGSGKSTASRALADLGAVVIDADAVARQVVEPGEPALDQIRAAFGEDVIRADGTLDRAGLAAIVFPDPEALRRLEAITGPAIADRVAQQRAAVPSDRVSVFDMPLLVEQGLWVREHLTLVVGASVETRVRRLVELRGLPEDDARARIAVQASDDERRAAADVWLENEDTPEDLRRRVEELWHARLAPFEDNLVHGRRSRRPETGSVVEPRAAWAAEGARVVARLEAGLADVPGVTEVSHIGSTSVPGLLAKDVVDVQVGVETLDAADAPEFVAAMRHAGYVLSQGNTQDTPQPAGDDPARWTKRFYGSCDPGRVCHVHVRERGSRGWEFALLFRDWLRSEPAEREAYAAEKRRLLASGLTTSEYVEAKEPWFDGAYARAYAWARGRWEPPAAG